MEQYQQKFNEQMKSLDETLRRYPQVKQLEEKFKVRPSHVVVSLAGVLLAFVLFGIGSNALCNLVGFAYPVYASFKAIKTDEKADDKQWLTYWVVFALFTVIESITDFFIPWIPFYFVAKMGFLIWLYYPTTKGAEVVFTKVIDPVLTKYQPRIEQASNKANQMAQSAKKVYDNITEEPGSQKKSM